uniref:hypothetical protein n=1 Tax=Tessaracoccus bendigoensis TaxID=72764 RepID=UPI001114B034|nr:hypothetical protein [Tessaracoccus bendigoensis]
MHPLEHVAVVVVVPILIVAVNFVEPGAYDCIEYDQAVLSTSARVHLLVAWSIVCLVVVCFTPEYSIQLVPQALETLMEAVPPDTERVASVHAVFEHPVVYGSVLKCDGAATEAVIGVIAVTSRTTGTTLATVLRMDLTATPFGWISRKCGLEFVDGQWVGQPIEWVDDGQRLCLSGLL